MSDVVDEISRINRDYELSPGIHYALKSAAAEITALRDKLASAEERDKFLREAVSRENDDICQTLGKALGYPWFKDDQINFPGADESNGVCVGDHVAASLAMEIATRLASAIKERDSICEKAVEKTFALDAAEARALTAETERAGLISRCEALETLWRNVARDLSRAEQYRTNLTENPDETLRLLLACSPDTDEYDDHRKRVAEFCGLLIAERDQARADHASCTILWEQDRGRAEAVRRRIARTLDELDRQIVACDSYAEKSGRPMSDPRETWLICNSHIRDRARELREVISQESAS